MLCSFIPLAFTVDGIILEKKRKENTRENSSIIVTEERLTELGLASQSFANQEADILRSQAVTMPSMDVNSVGNFNTRSCWEILWFNS